MDGSARVWWPRIRLAVLGAAAVLGSGCDPAIAVGDAGTGDPADDPFLPPQPVMEPFDYRACETGAVVAPCQDATCAEPGTERILLQFVDALSDYEFADYVDVSGATMDQYRYKHVVHYQVHVGWVRAGMELAVNPDDSEAAHAEAIAEALEALELPTSVADPAIVRDALVDCLPQVPFDPCIAFESALVASSSARINQGGWLTWRARVDTETGIVLTCGAE